MPYCAKHKKLISSNRWRRHLRKHAEETIALEDKKAVDLIVKAAIQKSLNIAPYYPPVGVIE